MSRVIVKNLPTEIKEEKIRGICAAYGEITDLKFKYTKSGVFRRFAFVGYRAELSAEKAVEGLHRAYIDSSRIQVSIAKDLGDGSLDRPWSKYSERSSAYQQKLAKQKAKQNAKQKIHEVTGKDEVKEKEKGKIKTGETALHELEDDPGFQEFKEAHRSRNKKPLWDNDAMVPTPPESQMAKINKDVSMTVEDDDSSNEVQMEDVEDRDVDSEFKTSRTDVKKANISDMDYLRSKMVKRVNPDNAESDSDDETDSETDIGKEFECSLSEKEDEEEEKEKGKHQEQRPQTALPKTKLLKAVKKDDKFERGQYVLKMRGVPFSVKENDIKNFFAPITIKAIRIPLNAKKQRTGTAFVEFFSDPDVIKALKRNKDYMGYRYIELFRDEEKQAKQKATNDFEVPWSKQAAELESTSEPVGETGRLFVRNLAYVCQEDDLEKLFSKYGPLTEVSLPIDPLTKKIKGFAFITFMMPEHAVKAFADLDGKTFQGRLLHILPGKEKPVSEVSDGQDSSYKKQKQAKDKARSGSSHNWNSLFIGSDAVAEAIAKKYQTTKSELLDAETDRSLAVRMALGETQIVAETRQFLLDNGVALDSFSQPLGARSKTTMLVKNLPAGTQATELRDLFSSHGSLGRIILPPAGVTAIVEFIEPTEARATFFKLAYTKFHHVPLYLEWAPVNIFSSECSQEPSNTDREGDRQGDRHGAKQSEDSTEPVPNQTAVQENKSEERTNDEEIDNLETEPNSTLFVKNLNFETTEESLQNLFCHCGKLHSVTISRKKDPKRQGAMLSMGYGFVEYKKTKSAQKALKELQHSTLDGHRLELKISHRASLSTNQDSAKKTPKNVKQKSSKILIRNIPFEAKKQEIQELFGTFGEIKSVRLPKKMSGTGSHRGFGFVDFLSKQDAERAFNALCHSSHLYGRRLVLEWADAEETVDDLRKKTADQFSEGGPRKKLKKSKLKEDLQLTMSSS